jgi:hypothetical protein
MVNKNIYKDTQIRSSETIAEELSRLREYFEQNNINEVNNCVDSLLRNQEFWILSYESIKSNPGVNSPGGSSLTGKAVTMDVINLEFFHKLSINIPKGRFNFGPIRKVDIPKPPEIENYQVYYINYKNKKEAGYYKSKFQNVENI